MTGHLLIAQAEDPGPRVGPSTAQLLARYDRPGPRYTSYPTAVEFSPSFREPDYIERLRLANALAEPLSIYVHLPFCEERCLFCGCNVIRTHHRDIAEKYLDYLLREIDLLAARLPDRRTVSQLHWGGGTPTYYPIEDLERLFGALADRFRFTPDAEISIEADPRVTSPGQVAALRRLGFNRLSVGVQDFSPEVQEAVRRRQSFDLTRDLIDVARGEGFESINIDLICGLPFQTTEGFQRTIENVVAIRPDRVAVYSFAHVPWLKPHQRRLPTESLPSASLKLELLGLAIDGFQKAGYQAIGMDHFALPDDELSRAVEDRRLHRNFMGYTVQSARDSIGIGLSSIGDLQRAYVQNTKKLSEYFEVLDAGHLPVERGYLLDDDDDLRRHVITSIMCNFHLDFGDVERRYGIDFAEYFAEELNELREEDSLVHHGLLELTPDALEVTRLGRLFVRNVAMAFDRYRRKPAQTSVPIFSRTV